MLSTARSFLRLRSLRRGSTATRTATVTLALVLVGASSAVGAPGILTLASTSTGGTKGNKASDVVSLSADGTKVAFDSSSTNLDPGDTDIYQDVYAKDLVSGTLILASTSSGGIKGDNQSRQAALSADGTKVAFSSRATNIHPADTDLIAEVFVKDLVSGTLHLASINSAGIKSNHHSIEPSLSADGNKVAFDSSSEILHPADPDGFEDVYIKDLVSGTLTLASTNSGGIKANLPNREPSLSADGTKVAFRSVATNLDSADADGFEDIYVKDLVSGTLILASTGSSGTKGNNHSREPSLSADGTKVAFLSFASNLDPGDTDTTPDVYVKDLVSGTLTLASTSSGGTNGNNSSRELSLSADGTKVAFDSFATNLDPGDTDGIEDMYVKDLVSGTLTLASTSSGNTKGNNQSRDPSLSSDGSKVAFRSHATNLHPSDTDGVADVYVKDLGDGGPQPVTVGIKIKKTTTIYTVTIITAQNFDATTVDVSTVCFGDVDAPAERDCTEVDGAGQLSDFEPDGDLDMILQFESAQTGIDTGETQACLTGQTSGGTPFSGCGAIAGGGRT